MSAVGILVARDRNTAWVLSDSAASMDGKRVGLSAKVLPVLHAQSVIVSKGHTLTASLGRDILALLSGFDEIREKACEMLAAYFADLAKLPVFTAAANAEHEFFCAGWSAHAQAMRAFLLKGSAATPFVAKDSEGMLFSPGLSEEEFHAAMRDDGIAAGSGTPVAMLIAAMEAQRRKPGELIGGPAVLTELSRDGITHRVVKVWE